MTNQIKFIQKAQAMEIIKPQIQITLTKGELNQLLTEAIADTESSAAIKKVLNPLLADKFPQFPEFTVIALGDTDESGSTQVTLKQPPVVAAKDPKEPKAPKPAKEVKDPVATPIKSIEPVVIDEPVGTEPESEPAPIATVYDSDIFDATTSAPAYVDPSA